MLQWYKKSKSPFWLANIGHTHLNVLQGTLTGYKTVSMKYWCLYSMTCISKQSEKIDYFYKVIIIILHASHWVGFWKIKPIFMVQDKGQNSTDTLTEVMSLWKPRNSSLQLGEANVPLSQWLIQWVASLDTIYHISWMNSQLLISTPPYPHFPLPASQLPSPPSHWPDQ